MTKKQPPILRNLNNFPPGAFYSTPPYNQAQKSTLIGSKNNSSGKSNASLSSGIKIGCSLTEILPSK